MFFPCCLVLECQTHEQVAGIVGQRVSQTVELDFRRSQKTVFDDEVREGIQFCRNATDRLVSEDRFSLLERGHSARAGRLTKFNIDVGQAKSKANVRCEEALVCLLYTSPSPRDS